MAAAKRSKDESEIRRLDKAWGDAATKHDVPAVVAFYARDGSLVWPEEKAQHGTAAIRKAWTQMMKAYPGLSLGFSPERIDVSQDGSLASDFGKVALAFDDPKAGRQKMTAKYLVVWKKEGGAWKVLYDSWNTNTKG